MVYLSSRELCFGWGRIAVYLLIFTVNFVKFNFSDTLFGVIWGITRRL